VHLSNIVYNWLKIIIAAKGLSFWMFKE